MKKVISIILFSAICAVCAAQPSYTLSQLRDSALASNISIRTARYDIQASDLQKEEAFTKYFPSVSATGVSFRADRSMLNETLKPSEMISPDLAAFLASILPPDILTSLNNPISISMMKKGTIGSVIAMQPIFAGGQIINGNRLAEVGRQASRLQLNLAENEVEKTTEQYFWQLASLQEKLKTIETAISYVSDINKDVSVAVKAGVATKNDLLQVQLRQNELESQKLKVINGISLMKMLIGQFCGLNNTDFSIQFDSANPDDLPERLDHIQALFQTREYQLLEKSVEAARLQKKLAIGQYLPTVAVGAAYNYHNLLKNDRTFGMVMATVSIPITDWWGGSYQIKRKEIEVNKAIEQQQDKAAMLQIRMQNAWNKVEESYQQLHIAKRSIEQAEENLRLQRDYYKAGLTNMSDLLQAQLLHQQTLDRYTDAYSEYQMAIMDYRHSVGQ